MVQHLSQTEGGGLNALPVTRQRPAHSAPVVLIVYV